MIILALILLSLSPPASSMVELQDKQELPVLSPGNYPAYQDYLSLYGKRYPLEEIPEREALYNQRVGSIREHNEKEGMEYLQTVNNFTDWTNAELNKYGNYRENTELERQGQENTKKLRKKMRQQNIRRLDATNLNWAELGAVTAVQDQGSCGSCWAFAATATAQSYAIVKKIANATLGLSEQYALKCTPGSSCDGGYTQDAMRRQALNGVPYRSAYPYTPSSTSTALCTNASFYLKFAQGSNYFRGLSDSEIISLLQRAPVAVNVNADDWYSYSSGILSCGSHSSITHAVELVGYTSTYWIIKNSWGIWWGQKGYVWITRAQSSNCLIGSGVMQFYGEIGSGSPLTFTSLLVILIIVIFC